MHRRTANTSRSPGLLGVAAFALASMLAACHKDAPVAPLVPARVAVTQGSDAQMGTVGQRLPSSVTVQVVDQNGSPMSGILVTWTIIAGGGTLDVGASTTDAAGDALVNWTLGTVARVDSLRATVAGAVSTVVVAIGQAAAVTSLKKLGGDQQAVPSGTTSAPMVVQAADQYGNAVPGVPITWSVQAGGSLSATRTPTDVGGRAAVTITTNATPATYSITAASGAIQVTFVVTGS